MVRFRGQDLSGPGLDLGLLPSLQAAMMHTGLHWMQPDIVINIIIIIAGCSLALSWCVR